MSNLKKQTLPERHEARNEAYDLLKVAERLVFLNPDDLTVRTLLQKATTILKLLRDADEKAFWEYADELTLMVKSDQYPHSIKTWYEDDFLPFLKEMRDEQ